MKCESVCTGPVKYCRGDKVLEPASLSSAKELLNRTFDLNSPDYALAKALIRHSLVLHILSLVMYVRC